MKCATWFRRAGWPLVLGMMVIAGGTVAAQDDRPPRREPPPPPLETYSGAHGYVRHENPGYQLKMSVGRVPKALDAQLGLDGQGVLVTGVHKDGPADKAGVKAHDILLAAGDKPLKGPADLVGIAKESEGKEVTLKLRRAGEEMTVTITPEKTPQGALELLDAAGRLDIRELRDLERTIREKVKGLGGNLRMQVIEPGMWLPRGAGFSFGRRADLPDDLSIDIHKQGKEPANIEVKQGEETWTVTENDLAPLPEEVRKHVEGFLGRGPLRFNVVEDGLMYTGPRPPHGRAGEPRGPDRPRPPRADRAGREGSGFRGPDDRGGEGLRDRIGDNLERRLDMMSRQMREMHERLDDLRRHLRDEVDRRDRPRRPERPEPPEESPGNDEE